MVEIATSFAAVSAEVGVSIPSCRRYHHQLG